MLYNGEVCITAYTWQSTGAATIIQNKLLIIIKEFDPRGRATVRAVNMDEICTAWNMQDEYRNANKTMRRRRCTSMKRKLDVVSGIEFIDITFPP